MQKVFQEGLSTATHRLDNSLENEKDKNIFFTGVPAVVEAISSGRSSAA